MSLLTREDIVEAYCSVSDKEWAIGGMEDATPFAHRIEAAVIRKLATVSVEPVVQFRGRGCEWFDGHPDESDGGGPYTTRTLNTPEALAAARVQMVEKVVALLKGIDYCETDADDGWWETSYQADFGKQKLAAIRALIGGNK